LLQASLACLTWAAVAVLICSGQSIRIRHHLSSIDLQKNQLGRRKRLQLKRRLGCIKIQFSRVVDLLMTHLIDTNINQTAF
jgi:hypothetical protein